MIHIVRHGDHFATIYLHLVRASYVHDATDCRYNTNPNKPDAHSIATIQVNSR